MNLIPLLYLKDKKAVFKGDSGEIQHTDPFELVGGWVRGGINWLQINDLNMSPTSTSPNEEIVSEIIKRFSLNVQLTGNFKTQNDIEKYLSIGVEKIILGSIAYQNPDITKEACQNHPGKIGVNIDVKNDKVTIPGYIVAANKSALDYAERFNSYGVSLFIHSNVDENNETQEHHLSAIKDFCQKCQIPIICSNQVQTQGDFSDFLKIEPFGLMGMIVDKALYERRFDLNSAITYINDQTLSGDDEPTLIP